MVYRGALFASAGLTQEHAERLLQDGLCDACCFGRSFIANPDLPERFLHGKPLAKGDESTYYGGAEKGLTDYPRAE
jgi:N-ethylmaleimide reductase